MIVKIDLPDIQAEFAPGQMIGVVGPDGAGKTTLMRQLAALLIPAKGTIQIAGFDTVSQSEEVKSLIGYMPQRFGLYEDLTVMQNLHLYADLRGAEREFDRLLDFTGLAPFTKRLARDLSGGMKQKLGLACALIKTPTVLLLDEPSVGVDPISRRELWKMTYELLEQGITIIWSTTYFDEAERCHQVLLLNEGKLLYKGKATNFEETFISLLGGPPVGESRLAAMMPPVSKESDYVIEVKDVVKKFNSFTAVDHISFQVKQGEIFGLLGPNGAGKSTTFKMLCGLLTPTSGSAIVEAKSQIGYMAQKFSLYSHLSVEQNLQFFAGIYRATGIEEMVEIFDLAPFLHTITENLPLGYKQRLALACANMHHPKILFLDEPTSGVDPRTRREFWSHINGLAKKGVTILITTHFMDEAEYCDRIALVYRGKVIAMDSPAKIKKMAKVATLEEAFITLVEQYDTP